MSCDLLVWFVQHGHINDDGGGGGAHIIMVFGVTFNLNSSDWIWSIRLVHFVCVCVCIHNKTFITFDSLSFWWLIFTIDTSNIQAFIVCVRVSVAKILWHSVTIIFRVSLCVFFSFLLSIWLNAIENTQHTHTHIAFVMVWRNSFG